MISAIGFIMVIALIVFGPRKTVELAQTGARLLGRLQQTTGDFQDQLHRELRDEHRTVHDPVSPASTSVADTAERQ